MFLFDSEARCNSPIVLRVGDATATGDLWAWGRVVNKVDVAVQTMPLNPSSTTSIQTNPREDSEVATPTPATGELSGLKETGTPCPGEDPTENPKDDPPPPRTSPTSPLHTGAELAIEQSGRNATATPVLTGSLRFDVDGIPVDATRITTKSTPSLTTSITAKPVIANAVDGTAAAGDSATSTHIMTTTVMADAVPTTSPLAPACRIVFQGLTPLQQDAQDAVRGVAWPVAIFERRFDVNVFDAPIWSPPSPTNPGREARPNEPVPREMEAPVEAPVEDRVLTAEVTLSVAEVVRGLEASLKNLWAGGPDRADRRPGVVTPVPSPRSKRPALALNKPFGSALKGPDSPLSNKKKVSFHQDLVQEIPEREAGQTEASEPTPPSHEIDPSTPQPLPRSQLQPRRDPPPQPLRIRECLPDMFPVNTLNMLVSMPFPRQRRESNSYKVPYRSVPLCLPSPASDV